MLTYILNNWINLLLVLVGLSAFGVYFWQKHDQVRVAATLVKGEIDAIEKSVSVLKNDGQLGNISVYHSKRILGKNLWDEYKHLLVKYLTQSEAALIERFFDNAEQIEHARIDIIRSLSNAWEHKSLVEHWVVGNYVQTIPSPENLRAQVEAFQQSYRPQELVFTPQISIAALVKYLGDFSMLSGTTAYDKIQKRSYEK